MAVLEGSISASDQPAGVPVEVRMLPWLWVKVSLNVCPAVSVAVTVNPMPSAIGKLFKQSDSYGKIPYPQPMGAWVVSAKQEAAAPPPGICMRAGRLDTSTGVPALKPPSGAASVTTT